MLGRLGLMSLLLSFQVFAQEKVLSQIKEISEGEKGEETLVFLSTGRVAKLAPESPEWTAALREAQEKKTWVNMSLDEERNILGVESVEMDVPRSSDPFVLMDGREYSPSILSSYGEAVAYFKEMKGGALEDSQCYNRAHVWAYEMKMRHDVNSQKIFVYFTSKYIRRYNFEWWFHVAPMVLVDESTGVMERVMDYRYSYAPQYVRDWTNYFMHNDAKCPVIKKYSDYDKNDGSQWCYLMKSSMYYYQPLDLLNLEKEGESANKTFFLDWEIRNAHAQAFGMSPRY